MSQPEQQSAVIACPHCGTRYQVAPSAIGTGRLVQCAHCQQSWQATVEETPPAAPPSEDDRLFDAKAEEELDRAFAAEQQAEAEAAAAAAMPTEPPPRPRRPPPPDRAAPGARPRQRERSSLDPAKLKQQQKAFSRRQVSMARSLPIGRLRRIARFVALGVLVVVIGGGITFRTELVRQMPDLAGLYEVLGMGVNVIGLEFRDVHTLRVLRDGREVMMIDARIVGVSGRTVVVPPVVVTVLDAHGNSIYEWSVTPQARDLAPGETVTFGTTLTQPPADAERVRLTFTNGRAELETPVAIEAGAPQPPVAVATDASHDEPTAVAEESAQDTPGHAEPALETPAHGETHH